MRELLLEVADYYRAHPDSWRNGFTLGIALIEFSENGNYREAVQALRAAISQENVQGSLTVWSQRHSVEAGIGLLMRVANEVP